MISLKQTGTFISGQVISRIEAKNSDETVTGYCKVLVPKAIKNGKINHDEIITIKLKTEVDEKKCTKEGDIILKLSQPYDAAYVTKKDEGILVTSFCMILRDITKDINPKYLAVFLNSNEYKIQAMSLTSGATIPMLTKGKIQQIKIKKLEDADQKEIINLNNDIVHKQQIFEEIIKLEKMKIENLLRGEK